MLRGCYKLPSTFSFGRLFFKESIVLNRSSKTRLPPSSPLAAVAVTVRPYSSDPGGEKPSPKLAVVGIPNPFIWFRTRIFYFLIRTYIDKEFSIEEFTEGAKQAFSHVSRLLSQCQFAALEGLVAEDLVGKLEEKCNLLPSNYKKALSADPDKIMYSMPGNVEIYYDDKGKLFVSILMRFWYLTSAQIPDKTIDGARVFKVTIRDAEGETEKLLTAIYEFQREFTKGVPPDWTIMRIEHSKLLD